MTLLRTAAKTDPKVRTSAAEWLAQVFAAALYGGQGRWRGRQIVPTAWIAECTEPAVVTEPIGGYGFQWWSTSAVWRGKRLAVTAAIGNGGQRLFLITDLELAVVTTAGDYNDPAISAPLNQILEEIIGAIHS